jgi:flagellar basal-body rod modification protein FlgD
MDVNPSSLSPAAAAPPPATSGAINADFDTFLKMMTTQLKNQDPLDPIDSADFAVQLATFSGVEQQVVTNDLLTRMMAQMGLSGLSDMASWIGQQVRAAVPVLFDGSPITISPNPAVLADRAELIVRDADGAEVQRLNIPVSSEPLEWAGVTTDGGPLPRGLYTFEVASYAREALLAQETADVYSTVTEVRAENGASILILEGGVAVSAANVSAIRQAG